MSRLTRNIVYNVAGQVLLLLLGFAAVQQTHGRLGKDALGILAFAAIIGAIIAGLLKIGVTAQREIAAHFEKEPEYIRQLVRTGSLLYWAVSAALVVGLFFATPFLVRSWISVTAVDPAEATAALRTLAAGYMLLLPRTFYASLLRGLQRMGLMNIMDVVLVALQQAGTLAILLSGGRLLDVARWITVAFAAGVVAYAIACACFFSWRAVVPGFSAEVLRRTAGFSRSMLSISILSTIHAQIDKVIVSRMIPLGALGYYVFASTNVARATLVTSSIANAALPQLTALYAAGDRSGVVTLYRKLQDAVAISVVPIFALICFIATPLFTCILNADAAAMLQWPTVLLSAGFVLNGLLIMPCVALVAAGKPEISARQHVWALFVVLPLTFLLILKLGLAGAALASIVAQAFAAVYLVPRIFSECLGLPAAAWWRDSLRTLALAVVTYGVAGALCRAMQWHTLWILLVAYAVASAAFLPVALALVGDELRATLRGWRTRLW